MPTLTLLGPTLNYVCRGTKEIQWATDFYMMAMNQKQKQAYFQESQLRRVLQMFTF